MPLPKSLARVLALPTASFRESAVLSYVERACRLLAGVSIRYDRYGNLLARYRRDPPRGVQPIAFVAHTDHPGFVALQMDDPRTLRAAFRGGVGADYLPNARVRFWNGANTVRGRVLRVSRTIPPAAPGGIERPAEALIRVARPVEPDAVGMWDLPEPALDGDRVVARACDDLAGVAALLALLERLSRRKARADVYALFTRAEEVGFVGAVGAIRARTIPKRVPVVSIETSSALVHAPIGAGPIVRVGDRNTVYTPAFTAFCVRVAQGLAARSKSFRYQRKLMDGGMCEAAAFGAWGYRVTGICLALGNYHNMDTRRRRIGSEWVSLADWRGMVDLFEALVLDPRGPGAEDEALRERIDKLFDDHAALL